MRGTCPPAATRTARRIRVVSRRLLVACSAAQVLAGVAGQVLAVRRGLAFDVAFTPWSGRRDRVGRDAWFIGTGVSAPAAWLTLEAVATAQLARADDRRLRRVLGAAGAATAVGYLVERETRTALRPRGSDPLVTPVVLAGLAASAAAAWLGLAPGAAAPSTTRRGDTPGR